MKKYAHVVEAEVVVNEETVVVRPSSGPTLVAKLLGKKADPKTGTESLYLDRVIFPAHVTSAGGYQVSGCFSTVLSRIPG